MGKKGTRDMFLTARQKSENDFELGKKMIDTVDGMLRNNLDRIELINECWHLHAGKWPELAIRLGKDPVVMKDEAGNKIDLNLDDYITHHPKINNVTAYIMGHIITQPLIPIVKDFSSYGRSYREAKRRQNTRNYYTENLIQPIFELERQKYIQENNIQDPMALNPDEQNQMQLDLQKRMKNAIPRSVIDDMKRIRTPDESLRQTLLNYDIKAYEIEEKFIQGGEQAVVAYEEYYKVGRKGIKPTMDVLNAKWVNWHGSENTDYAEDGVMARYEEYLDVHDFITKYGRKIIDRPGFLNDIKEYFTEIPGYFRDGVRIGADDTQDYFMRETELDFVDLIGSNPDLIKNDWRTRAGQQDIAHVYRLLSTHRKIGWGIRDVYTVFKWTELMTYVQRRENGKIKEYIFSSDYDRNPTRDIVVKKYPINRVYHGNKIAERFYIGVEAVPWQFFGGIHNFEPKLTICGRRYSKMNGVDHNRTLISPSIQYQLRYNITASKLEDLEKKDLGPILMFNTSMRPHGWSEPEYTAQLLKQQVVPYTRNQTHNDPNAKDKPISVENTNSGDRKEYRELMDFWEREMYKACGLNRDTLGMANQYQSNALTQSNIAGSEKQLLPFYNKRRALKERVLNYFSNVSLMCFLEDYEKQELLLDEFAKQHLEVNEDDIRGNLTSIFIVDDFEESENLKIIRGHILSMFQAGMTATEIIDYYRVKSLGEMYDIAEISEIRRKEEEREKQEALMAQIQEENKGLKTAEEIRQMREDLREQRKAQVNLAMAEMESQINYNAVDVDKNKIHDSLQTAREKIIAEEKIAREDRESRERIEREKRAVEREKNRKITGSK